MRIIYAEEEALAGQAALWEANMERSISGRKGQAALRRVEAALLALPEKKLAANALETDDGTVCALAALAKYEHYQGSLALPSPPADENDYAGWDEWDAEGSEQVEEAMLNLAAGLRVPKLVAMAIIERNDEDAWHRNALTPERRYERVLSWVQQKIQRTVTSEAS